MLNINQLISKVVEVTASGLPFMEGKEKGEVVIGELYLMNEYGFLEGKDGEYIVFTTHDDKDHFYFGNTVLTQKMKTIEETITTDELGTLLNEGIELVFGEKVSKNKRKYQTCEFYPTHQNK